MLIPIIESIDENKVVPSAKTVYRDSIMLVVKHPTEEKYLYLQNKKFDWKVLVQGGVDPNENVMISALRELIEETGFNDIKSIKKLDFEMDNVYYAAHKKENRYAIIKTFFVELNSLTQIKHEDEADIFFDTYENLYELFGPSFRHHYYLLGLVLNKEEVKKNKDNTMLGNLKLVNQIVKYRDSSEDPSLD